MVAQNKHLGATNDNTDLTLSQRICDSC